MKLISYKNIATGLAESYEVGSRGDRKRRADSRHYTCLNPELLPKKDADGQIQGVDSKAKKPEKGA